MASNDDAGSYGPLKLDGNPADIVKQLDTRTLTLTRARAGVDYQAKLNLAYYRGFQWVVPIAGTSATPTLRRAQTDPNDPTSRVMLTVNKIGSRVDRLVARITKGEPVPECRPVSLEEQALSTARVGTRILASETERLFIQDQLVRLYYWVVNCGSGFLHPYWDASAGDTVTDKKGNPVIGKKGQPLHVGEVAVDVVPHFEMVMDPQARDISEARWCIHTVALTAEEVYERWGKDVSSTPTDKLFTISDELRRLQSPLYAPQREIARVAVRRFWLKAGANRSRPNGMMLTWAGTDILDEPRDFPFDHNHLPFAQFNYLPPSIGPWGSTPVSDLIELQTDYNHARSREADIRDRLTPKMLAPENSFDPDLISDLVEVIPYRPVGPAPTITDVPTNWMQMFEFVMKRVDEEMDERISTPPAMTGELAGTAPGVTVLAQQEAAAEPLSTPAKGMARGLQEYGWQHLMLVKQYWDEPRLVRTYSENGDLEVYRFSKDDLKDQVDVRVTPESALPRSKAGRLQMLLQFWNEGIIKDPRIFVKLLDLPPTDLLAHTFDVDAQQAERENDTMAQLSYFYEDVPLLDPVTAQPLTNELGAKLTHKQIRIDVPVVEKWHNHQIHLPIHYDYRKTREYELLPQDAKDAFEAHCEMHEALLLENAQAAAGGVPVPGGSAPPSPVGPPGSPPANGNGVPSIPELAGMQGGVAGQPGPVPGVPSDQQAAAIGR